MQNTNTLTLTQPDDWHCHFRDGDMLTRTVADTAKSFCRAIVMPNTLPPITDLALAKAYKARITNAIPAGKQFTPLMVLYLTQHTTPALIHEAKATDAITAVKLYPAGATTHSDAGVVDLKALYPVFAAMEQCQLPLLIHGEHTDPTLDIFDREAAFITAYLKPLINDFPRLPMVLEHISTKEAVDFIKTAPSHIGATITAHHLLCNRNDIFRGGINPHHYCLPILKRASHQQALIEAATSGDPHFFLGTDSAPHPQSQKESPCGCAGIYTAHCAIELYAHIFEQQHALDKLEGFASHFGADFYGLPRNKSTITLHKNPWTVPTTLTFGQHTLIPFQGGNTLTWQQRIQS
ncbi:MAG: dihydroorotase [Gammaproteobacteria bacterium]